MLFPSTLLLAGLSLRSWLRSQFHLQQSPQCILKPEWMQGELLVLLWWFVPIHFRSPMIFREGPTWLAARNNLLCIVKYPTLPWQSTAGTQLLKAAATSLRAHSFHIQAYTVQSVVKRKVESLAVGISKSEIGDAVGS